VPPAWTLSHELKFYILFAVAIALPSRIWKPLLAAMLMGSAAAGVVEAIAPTTLPFAISFLFSPYNLEFVAGSVIAAVILRRTVAVPWAWGAIGLVAWSIAAAHDQSLIAPDVAEVLRYGVPSALIVLAVAAQDLRHPSFDAPALRLFGDASYAVYLVHLPVIIVAIRLGKQVHIEPTTWSLLAVAAVATAVGILFHIVVERPVTRYLTGRFAARPRASARVLAVGK
jgi:exopolysaccharide production protein ExoZ